MSQISAHSLERDVYQLPDLFMGWPFARPIPNPNLKTISRLSSEWIRSFQGIDTPRMREIFRKTNCGLIAALAYPNLEPEKFRVACDLMHIFFVNDDLSDSKSAKEVRHLTGIAIDALRNNREPRPVGEHVIGEIHRQFWQNASRHGSPTFQKKFIEDYQDYLDGLSERAHDRENHQVRSTAQYNALRRKTIGVKSIVDILLLSPGLNISESDLNHPRLDKIVDLAIEMMIRENDIYSYNKEQASSVGAEGHNAVTVVMKDHGLNLQTAMDILGASHVSLAAEFSRIAGPSCSLPDGLSQFSSGIAGVVTAHLEWCFESERYFGTKGLDIKEHRFVQLLPKKNTFSSDNQGKQRPFTRPSQGVQGVDMHPEPEFRLLPTADLVSRA